MLKFLILSILLSSAAAAPRGARNGGSIRGIAERQLQKDNDMNNNMGGGGGGGGGNGDGNGGGNGILEVHGCEPDPQVARDYVDIQGHADKGDMDCYADPVNACGGGCCRFDKYFICDSDTFPHLACVCNGNTAPLPVVTPNPTVAPVATPNPTVAPVLPAATPEPFTLPPAAGGVTLPPAATFTLPPVNTTDMGGNATMRSADYVLDPESDIFD
ncbi:expressed unknown protein [Seminavis robusta]|uniref:Uncharacterized protein n=1 Tax=Seminavis robusta TaxID=568900 RepID=A0A9N8EIW4_9STRA|nr:expressed unknown protein [Seminavis robusta]|eukprot:Sro1061_g236810.1 n/a (215) ;mRNA; f:15822-16574